MYRKVRRKRTAHRVPPLKKFYLRATMFADGANGSRTQEYKNVQYGITCLAHLAHRDAKWENMWTSELTGTEIFSSYRELRAAYLALIKKQTTSRKPATPAEPAQKPDVSA